MYTLHTHETDQNQIARQTQIAHEIAEIIPINSLRRVERINGHPLSLGTMSYDELQGVYDTCLVRAERANTDSDMVALHIEARFPNYPTEELPFIA